MVQQLTEAGGRPAHPQINPPDPGPHAGSVHPAAHCDEDDLVVPGQPVDDPPHDHLTAPRIDGMVEDRDGDPRSPCVRSAHHDTFSPAAACQRGAGTKYRSATVGTVSGNSDGN